MNVFKKISTLTIAAVVAVTLTSSFQAPDANAATSCYKQVFRSSNTSKTCVKYLQQLVNNVYASNQGILGKRAALKVDGVYGQKTASAIRNIQAHASVTLWKGRSEGREIFLAKDSVTGPQTWAVICTNSIGSSSIERKAGCGSVWNDFYATTLYPRAH